VGILLGARGRDCAVSASQTPHEVLDHDGTCAECEQDMAAALRVTKEEYEAAGRE